MKTVFSITGVFMLLFALSCVKEEVPLNETSSEGEIILGYDYPIKPGTTEWEKLVNAQEKISVCQIPPSILSTLTTEELVNTCLRYPPLNNIYAFNNILTGTERLVQEFNGIRELFNRADAYPEMLKVYSRKIDNSSALQEQGASLKKGNYIISLSSIEMILSQIELRTQPDIEMRKKVMNELLRGYKLKLNNSEEFKGVGFTTNLLARAAIVLGKDHAVFSSKEGGWPGGLDPALTAPIDEKSYQFIR
ncbi:hypothetical protein [Arcticibacter tournemirensis]